MSVYRIRTTGGVYRVTTEDAPSASPKKPQTFDDKLTTRASEALPDRPNPFLAGAEAVKSLTMQDFIPGNVAGSGKQAMALLQVLGAPYQAASSVMANRALSSQKNLKDLFNPLTAVKDVAAGLTGPQRTFGDVLYRAGVDRNVADPVGFVGEMAVTAPNLVRGGINLARGGVGLAGRGLRAVGKPVSNIFGNISESFKSGGKLKDVANEMGRISSDLEKLKTISKPIAEGRLTGSILAKSESNKGILNSLGHRITNTYGKILDQIENNMPFKVTDKDFVKLSNDTLEELSSSNLLDTKVSSSLKRMVDKFTPKETGEIQLALNQFNLRKLKGLKKEILGSYTPGRSEESAAKGIFLKNYGKMLEEFGGDDLKNLNKEFSPFINDFNRASKVFNSKNSNLVQRGANALRRIAEGTGDPSKMNYVDDLNMLRNLERGSGRFLGVGKGKLTGNFSKEINEIEKIDSEISSLIKQKSLLGSEQSRLSELRTLRNQILVGIASTLGLGGATGLVIKASK